MERQAEEIFAELLNMGKGSMLEGCINGIEANYFQGRIADSSYQLERNFNNGTRTVVGANRFLEGNDETELETLRITGEDELKQRDRLEGVRQAPCRPAVRRFLGVPGKGGADPEVNLMPAL